MINASLRPRSHVLYQQHEQAKLEGCTQRNKWFIQKNMYESY